MVAAEEDVQEKRGENHRLTAHDAWVCPCALFAQRPMWFFGGPASVPVRDWERPAHDRRLKAGVVEQQAMRNGQHQHHNKRMRGRNNNNNNSSNNNNNSSNWILQSED